MDDWKSYSRVIMIAAVKKVIGSLKNTCAQ
jgi:hypothetical protein